jgi:hypothetical protein
MDNVQKHNICTYVPSSQTFRSYLRIGSLKGTSIIYERYFLCSSAYRVTSLALMFMHC